MIGANYKSIYVSIYLYSLTAIFVNRFSCYLRSRHLKITKTLKKSKVQYLFWYFEKHSCERNEMIIEKSSFEKIRKFTIYVRSKFSITKLKFEGNRNLSGKQFKKRKLKNIRRVHLVIYQLVLCRRRKSFLRFISICVHTFESNYHPHISVTLTLTSVHLKL